MTTTLTLRVPAPLPLSANQRLHHAPKAQRVKTLRNAAELAARGMTFPDPAHLTVRIGWPNKIRRDAHNAIPTIKAQIDGFVRAGALADDSDAHLLGPDLRPHIAGKKGVVVLTYIFRPAITCTFCDELSQEWCYREQNHCRECIPRCHVCVEETQIERNAS